MPGPLAANTVQTMNKLLKAMLLPYDLQVPNSVEFEETKLHLLLNSNRRLALSYTVIFTQ